MNQDWIKSIWQILNADGLQGLTADSLIALHPKDAFEIYQKLASPHDCLIYLWEDTNEKVLQKFDRSLQGKDAFFDMIMGCFEVLSCQKVAVRRLVRSLYCTPTVSMALHTYAVKWADNSLALANKEYSGVRGLMMRYGFLAFFVCCIEKWLEDDTADMSKTMIFVDNALNQIEAFSGYIPKNFW